MPRFYYVAQDKNNTITSGVLDAQNKNKALTTLLERGLQPIKLDLTKTEAAEAQKGFFIKLLTSSVGGGKLNIFDQIIIIRNLGIILSTGTDILTGLEIIGKDAIKPIVKKIMYDLKGRISRGEKLSSALSAWQDHFNPIFINLVKSGEISGNLPGIFLSYAQELQKDYAFMRKLRGALFYPGILISSLAGMVLIILWFVAPRLKELFISLKTTPPFYMKFFFLLSDIWRAYTIPIIVIIGFFILFCVVIYRYKKIRLRVIVYLKYLPFINTIQRNISLLRFSKTVANLINAGFSLKAALLTTSEVVDLRYKTIILEIAQKSLEHGISLADSMKKYPEFFPDILISAVATGEKSGKLSTVLLQMSEFYEENVIYSLETFLTFLEPLLLIIVGISIGLMAGAMISPIYKLIGKF